MADNDWWGQVLGSPGPNDRILLHLFAPDGTDIKIFLTRDRAREIGTGLTKIADATLVTDGR